MSWLSSQIQKAQQSAQNQLDKLSGVDEAESGMGGQFDAFYKMLADRKRVTDAWAGGHSPIWSGGQKDHIATPTSTVASAPPPVPMGGLLPASQYQGPTDIYGAPRPEDWGAAPAPGLGGLLPQAQGPVTQENLPKMGEWDGGPMEPGEVVGQPTGGLLAGGSYVAPSAGVFGGFTPDAQPMTNARSNEGRHLPSSDPGGDFEEWLQGRRPSGMGGGAYMGEMGLIRDSIYAPRRGFETAGLLAGSAHGGAPGSTGWNGGQLVVG